MLFNKKQFQEWRETLKKIGQQMDMALNDMVANYQYDASGNERETIKRLDNVRKNVHEAEDGVRHFLEVHRDGPNNAPMVDNYWQR